MKQKVLICGATGFIGRNLTEQLSKRPDLEVHAVRFQRPPYACENVIWHQADLRKPEDIERVIHGTDIAIMNSYLFRAAFLHNVKQVVFFSCTVMYQSSDTALKETDFNVNK